MIELRRRQLSPEVIGEVAKSVREGLPIRHACALSGVPESTGRSWLKKGCSDLELEKSSLEAVFFAQVAFARAECVRESVQAVRSGVDSGGHRWWLSRQEWQEFGDRQIMQPAEPEPIDEAAALEEIRRLLEGGGE